MKYIFVALLSVTLLSGCSLFNSRSLDFSTKPIAKVPLILPDIDQYNSRDVEWIIVTSENYKEVLDKNIAIFALTSKGYENISLNASDILKLIRQQQSLIAAYKKYTDSDFATDVEDPEED